MDATEPTVSMSAFAKARIEAFKSNLELAQVRGHNASLIEQLAAANKRIAELETRLAGNNELRRIAVMTAMPQEEVFNRLLAWVKAGKP